MKKDRIWYDSIRSDRNWQDWTGIDRIEEVKTTCKKLDRIWGNPNHWKKATSKTARRSSRSKMTKILYSRYGLESRVILEKSIIELLIKNAFILSYRKVHWPSTCSLTKINGCEVYCTMNNLKKFCLETVFILGVLD